MLMSFSVVNSESIEWNQGTTQVLVPLLTWVGDTTIEDAEDEA